MTSSSSSRLVLALIANLAFASSACGIFGSDSDTNVEPPAPVVDTPDAGEEVKAPPVQGTPPASELTDDLGIFVTTTGSDTAAGTHLEPLLTVQAGIEKARSVGKRVYVCTGVYKEALLLADSISIIGGLDCPGNAWSTGAGQSRIEAPTSPAVRAKDITSATRIEGLEIIAPNATSPSGSSIALVADHASALTIARSQLVAGNAMKGDDGVEGVQLSNAATTMGDAIPAGVQCLPGGVCDAIKNIDGSVAFWIASSGGKGGTNTCVGAPGHIAESGGAGGSGGLNQVGFDFYDGYGNPVWVWKEYRFGVPATPAPAGHTGAAGADGDDGFTAASTISPDGYAAADGVSGGDGSTGFGGAGGNGQSPKIYGPVAPNGAVWRGWGGGGGGAGGCPGLAGTAGKGGGASIAAVLVESPITFDGSTLSAGAGGDGGHGTLGSAPTAGGLRNNPEILATGQMLSPSLGHNGGRGGAAGVSGNGGSGPSLGIAHKGAPPVITGGTTITPGSGGAAIDARSRTDAVSGLTKTIPATPAGTSKDILAL